MTKILVIFTVVNLVSFGLFSLGAKNRDLKGFPAAPRGMARFVIALPDKAGGEEPAVAVWMTAGKPVAADGATPVRGGFAIVPRTLADTGYTYYEVTAVPGAPLKARFTGGYPIVVYAPAGIEVRYRISGGTETMVAAEQR